MRAKVDSRAMREMNRALLLELIRQEATITRIDLARRSALTKPTVSTIVDALIAEGLVHEVGLGESGAQGGRRGRLLGLNADAAAFAGVHLSIRYTSIAVADARGRIRAAKTVPSFRGEPGRALQELPGLLTSVMREAKLPRSRLRGIGVAAPGLVDHTTGTCVLAPNLRWYDVPLRARLIEAFGTPAAVRNTMQAGAIAEARLGAARRARSFAWVYLGTGIGAALVIDGRVFYGKRGYSGELGHCKVADAGPVCGCGRRGCLETVASVPAIEGYARSGAAGRRGGSSKKLDAYAIAHAASNGDAAARAAVARAGRYMGVGISYLLNLLDLEMVVLAGRVVRAGDWLIETIRGSVSEHTMQGPGIPIVASTVEDDVVLKGAVLLAMEGDQVERPIPVEDSEWTRRWASPHAVED
jgi:predicted NBD/HSP70 family sugar kinase